MSFSLVVREPVLYVSWKSFTAADLRRVVRHAQELRRASGKPVVYVARIPYDNRKFTPEEHDVLVAFLNDILPSCATIHHVLEGDGFIKSARTAIVSTMALKTARPRDFYVHDSLRSVASLVHTMYGVDLEDIVRERASRNPPAPKPEGQPEAPKQTASSAFRKAVKIAHGRDD